MPRRMRAKWDVDADVATRARSCAYGLHLLQAFQIDDPDVFALCVDQAAFLKS
jgi:hypothetical protein